jgi:3-oxoacyl-[acyl-carrier protein] reductase
MTTALITGAARNIGRATALALADAGHDVVVHTRSDRPAAEEVAEEVRARGQAAWVFLADVSNEPGVHELRDRTLESAGSVDILVNNAAIRDHDELLTLDYEQWRRIVGVILDGAFLCSRAFVPGMIELGWGRIINIVGVRGEEGEAGRAHVCAAKNGLIGLTRATAREFGRHGITVNAVSPGTVETDRDRRDPSRLERRASLREVAEAGKPEDVSAAVAFLASREARFITGQVLGVNGGERMA